MTIAQKERMARAIQGGSKLGGSGVAAHGHRA
jgi:hypothetical protein